MAVTGDIDFKIDKLIGENYHNWKFKMKMYLIGSNRDGGIGRDHVCTRTMNQALACICLSAATNLQIYNLLKLRRRHRTILLVI